MTTDINNCREAAALLRRLDMPSLVSRIESLIAKTSDNRFTVAFVGEFSRGKSTLINSLVGADVLPASGLPTTALLTRVGFGKTPSVILLNPDGSRRETLPLSKEAWKALSIDHFGRSADNSPKEGSAAITLPLKWLGQEGIILLDTPGAGDLEESRMKSVSKALLSSDAAVITIDATQPMSLSEQSFIRQRVVATRTPFIAVAVTKMDLIPLSERDTQMDYIIRSMRRQGWNFPVIIGGNGVEMPSGKYDDINGSKFLRSLIIGWVKSPARSNLTQTWLRSNVAAVLDMAIAAWSDQKRIADARGDDHRRLLREREEALGALRPRWEKLREEMIRRCEEATAGFDSRMQQAAAMMTERLQHEVDRFPNPKKWVENEYNFRLRHELAALSQGLDSWATRTVGRDIAWLNRQLQEQFRTSLAIEAAGPGPFDESSVVTDTDSLALEDLSKSRTTASAATIVIGLGAAVALASFGGFIPLATMGISGGAGLLSRSVFEKKTEQQRAEVKDLIGREVPGILRQASAESRSRFRKTYSDILRGALTQEEEWYKVQTDIIRQTHDTKGEELSARIDRTLQELTAMRDRFTINDK